MIDPIAVRRTPTSGMPKPPARAAPAARTAPSATPRATTDIPAMRMRSSTDDTDGPDRPTSAIAEVAESISARYTAHMSDSHLVWKLGARHPGHDYRIFTTGFVDATNPRTG